MLDQQHQPKAWGIREDLQQPSTLHIFPAASSLGDYSAGIAAWYHRSVEGRNSISRLGKCLLAEGGELGLFTNPTFFPQKQDKDLDLEMKTTKTSNKWHATLLTRAFCGPETSCFETGLLKRLVTWTSDEPQIVHNGYPATLSTEHVVAIWVELKVPEETVKMVVHNFHNSVLVAFSLLGIQ